MHYEGPDNETTSSLGRILRRSYIKYYIGRCQLVSEANYQTNFLRMSMRLFK
jgi:hypothetical protein